VYSKVKELYKTKRNKRNGSRLFIIPFLYSSCSTENKFSINFTIDDVTRQECDLHSRVYAVTAILVISCKYYLLVENNADIPGTCMTYGMKAIMTAASIGVSLNVCRPRS